MITTNVEAILRQLPPGVQVVAAVKTRSAAEIMEAHAAGIRIVGENYLQDASAVMPHCHAPLEWHFIGHVQKNKVRQIVPAFDLIETVDSLELGRLIASCATKHAKTMPVLIEINSGREPQKHGVWPEQAAELVENLGWLEGLKVVGLMTMGPFLDDPAGLRSYFRATRRLFEELKALHPKIHIMTANQFELAKAILS
jgi:hypothetical protein